MKSRNKQEQEPTVHGLTPTEYLELWFFKHEILIVEEAKLSKVLFTQVFALFL